MSSPLHAFDFLAESQPSDPPGVCVLFGGETFLRRLVLAQLESAIVGDNEEVEAARYDGDTLEWRDCYDELSTQSLFGGGGRRMVIIDPADGFVTRHRDRLEAYVAAPKRSGVLVLTVDSLPSNTRLYKAMASGQQLIECRPPERSAGKKKVLDENKLSRWLVQWAKRQHRAKLSSEAAAWLVDTVGPQLGLLDQHVAKLALFVDEGESISFELAREAIGGWRDQSTWDLMDAAADGNAAAALLQLDRILQAGEHPVALFGQLAWSLRRFAAATRIYQRAERQRQRVSLRDALLGAGFRQWPKEALANAERQLKQLGRQRAAGMYRTLLELDLRMKGSHSQADRARYALEQVVLRMAKQ